MHTILLALGIAAIVAGGVMLGYGIPINEFGLGNTLILAGTTTIVGGLIVVALSIVVRQLTRIAASLGQAEKAPVSPAATPEQPRGWVESIPVAVVPVPGAPTSAVQQSEAAREPLPLREPDRPPPPREPPSLREPFSVREPLLGREPPARAPLPLQREPLLPTAAVPRPRGDEAVGPSGAQPRPARTGRGDKPNVLSARERTLDRPAEPVPPERREPTRPDERTGGPPRNESAVSVLKSGVIDGMAYTIYSDGSIEAELPQGTMRFTTFEELRAYLADAS
jgi:hypothetical protein